MDINALEAMIERGQDSAMVRLTLGRAYHQQGDWGLAETHLRQAVALKPDYAAAWKTLAQSLEAADRPQEALEAFDQALETASANGDMQLVRETKVFRKRLQRKHEAE